MIDSEISRSTPQRTAIITGGASGIGLATAHKLAGSGVNVVLADYNEDALNKQLKEFEAQALPVAAYRVNISSSEEVQGLFEFTRQKFGSVQILVNSAGIVGPNKPATEVSLEEWQGTLAVNLTGTFLCCQAALKEMIPAGYGWIVNVASIAGKEGNPNLAAYSASKGAVIALTKSLAKEAAPYNVIVNALSPAVIATPMNQDTNQQTLDYMISRIPLGRVGQPQEVAELIAWMASDACSFTTGFCFDISGGRATY